MEVRRPNFSPMHLTRLLGIVAVGAAVYFLSPALPTGEVPSLLSPTYVVLVFVFIAGFLIQTALRRLREIDMAMTVELMQLRRIVHLADGMKATKKWKQSVRDAIVQYLKSVSQKNFRHYEKSHEYFREATKLIYHFAPKTRKDEIVYGELLTVTRQAALERNRVSNRIPSSVETYTWIALLFVAALCIALLILSRESNLSSGLFTGGSVMGMLFVLDILYDIDNLNRDEQLMYRRRYQQNAKDIAKV